MADRTPMPPEARAAAWAAYRAAEPPAVAAALGELHAEPVSPPTEDDLARGRAIVAAARSFNERGAARVAENGADR